MSRALGDEVQSAGSAASHPAAGIGRSVGRHEHEKARARRPLMALGMLALLVGMWAGLARLGWGIPVPLRVWPGIHGPLMISGFLGTLIGLERAVGITALQSLPQLQAHREDRWYHRWPYLAPLLTGIGALSLIVGLPDRWGALLMTGGSLVLTVAFLILSLRHRALPIAIIGLGALAWLVGNGLWLWGRPLPDVVLWWASFLILTIVGERLELNRLRRPPRRVQRAFFGAVGLFMAGVLLSGFERDTGVRLAGLGMIGLALWLWRYDIARYTVRQSGLARFIAVCLLSGYGWLGVGGALAVAFGGVSAGMAYDALLHAVFLGFVFAMIFAHAPIILPAVLGTPVAFRPAFYLHWAVLQFSLLLRVLGDVAIWLPGRRWGGLLNVLTLLLFLASTMYAVRKGGEQLSPGG